MIRTDIPTGSWSPDDPLRPDQDRDMDAITFQDVESLAFESVPDPVVLDGSDVIVRTRVAGLCGSDLHPYLGRERGIEPGTVMGHELVGEVVEVGGDVRDLSVGDRVVAPFTTSCGRCFYCRMGLTARCDRGQLFGWVQNGTGLHGCQAELVRVPLADGTLVQVPEGLDDAVALLAGDILSTAMFGAELAGVTEGDLVVVVGCGPVGLLSIRAALEGGAREVIAVDPVPSRLALASRFGATPGARNPDERLAQVRERSQGKGADAAIEAVGAPEATRDAVELLRFGATLAALGDHTEAHLAIPPGEIYDRNLSYAAGRCPARRFMPSALALARRDADLMVSLISHRLPLADGVDAYRRFAAREEGWAKVVFTP